jgi:Zn-dependent protease
MFSTLLQNLNLQNIDIQGIIIRVFVVCISLSFHEMCHAWRAYKLGDDTAQLAGRLTMNPLKHLDPIGTIMMIVARVGWAKPVPINPVLFTRAKTMKRGIVEVSLAGPLSNLFLAVVSYFLLQTANLVQILGFGAVTSANSINPVIDVLETLFVYLYISNIYLAIFNLLPVPPLDGFKVFGSMLPGKWYYKLMDYERYIGLVFLAIIFFAGSVFGSVLRVVATPFQFIIEKPINFLFDSIFKLF